MKWLQILNGGRNHETQQEKHQLRDPGDGGQAPQELHQARARQYRFSQVVRYGPPRADSGHEGQDQGAARRLRLRRGRLPGGSARNQRQSPHDRRTARCVYLEAGQSGGSPQGRKGAPHRHELRFGSDQPVQGAQRHRRSRRADDVRGHVLQHQ